MNRSHQTITRLLARGAAAALAAVAVAGCADGSSAPTGPAAAPQLAVAGESEIAQGLRYLQPQNGFLLASQSIGSKGGKIRFADGSVTLTVPKGAVTKTTLFTVRVIPGSVVAVEFGPHGTTFNVPLELEVDLKKANLTELTANSKLELAYFPTPALLDQVAGTVVASEFVPVTFDVKGKKARAQLRHFSGYMVSSGRYRPRPRR
jgi:hypothetical protein